MSKKQTSKYIYPIYAYPENWKGTLPTRQQIDGEGILQGKGLELAYAKRLEDIYYMQLQGSGLVKFKNEQNQYFGYAGTNRHSYSSIGRYIKNNESIRLKNISKSIETIRGLNISFFMSLTLIFETFSPWNTPTTTKKYTKIDQAS